jgi:hypothetical protein
MPSRTLSGLLKLDLEEKIINISALLAAICVFFPWLSGDWLNSEAVLYSGFGFYTSFLGVAIFLMNIAILAITFIPALGGPTLMKRRYKDIARVGLALQSVILILATLTVLTHVTFDFAKMEVRFGIFLTLVSNLVTLFESFIRFFGQRKHADEQEVFHHPQHHESLVERKEFMHAPKPPPPPPPPEPEEHRLYHHQ